MAECTACCLSLMQHWQKVAPLGPNRPRERYLHVAITLVSHHDRQHPLLFILGGHPNKDCWLYDIHARTWTRVGFVVLLEDNMLQWYVDTQ